jgi:hypothetical protein
MVLRKLKVLGRTLCLTKNPCLSKRVLVLLSILPFFASPFSLSLSLFFVCWSVGLSLFPCRHYSVVSVEKFIM